MAGTNTPYIAKAAQPLTNPTALSVFTQVPSPIATVAATQVLKPAFIAYKGYSQVGEGVSNNVDLIRIRVTAAGRATGGTTTNWTPSIQISAAATNGIPSTTAASNTTIATGTATAYNSVTGNWLLTVELLWDPTSGQINGLLSGYGGSGGAQTTTTSAAITPQTGYTATAPTSVQSNTTAVTIPAPTGELVLYFAAGGLFSATNANNVAFLDNFSAEVL